MNQALSAAAAANREVYHRDTLTSIENVTGSDFDDELIGDGNANVLAGGLGDDIIDGGGGNDTVSYEDIVEEADSGFTVTVDLGQEDVEQDTGVTGRDTLSNIDNIIGSNFSDHLIGNQFANILTGNAGDDILEGGAGNDILDGGDGIDTASYAGADDGVTVSLEIEGEQDTGDDTQA